MEWKESIGPASEFDMKKELIELGILIVIATITSTFSIIVVGLVKRAFTEQTFLQQFLFYGPFFAFIVGVLSLKLVEIFSKGKYADVVVHDTKTKPAFISRVFRFVDNPLLLVLLSVTITGWLSFLGSAFNIFYFPVKQATVAQQLTPFSHFLSYIEPAVTLESFLLFFVIGIELTSLLLIFNKLKINNKNLYSVVAIIFFSIVNGFLWMGLHKLRYTGEEGSLLYSFFFGGFGTFITLAIGSVIFFWIWHFMNNAFLALKVVYGKDIFLGLSVVGLIFITIITIFSIYYYYKRKNKFTS